MDESLKRFKEEMESSVNFKVSQDECLSKDYVVQVCYNYMCSAYRKGWNDHKEMMEDNN